MLLGFFDILCCLNITNVSSGYLSLDFVNSFFFLLEQLLALLNMSLEVFDMLLGILEDFFELILGRAIRLCFHNGLKFLHMF